MDAEELPCVLCRAEGEGFARSHRLRDEEGRAMCPKLRSQVCETCGGTGDDAHNTFFCPQNAEKRLKTDKETLIDWDEVNDTIKPHRFSDIAHHEIPRGVYDSFSANFEPLRVVRTFGGCQLEPSF